jgi:hypothetical protein
MGAILQNGTPAHGHDVISHMYSLDQSSCSVHEKSINTTIHAVEGGGYAKA